MHRIGTMTQGESHAQEESHQRPELESAHDFALVDDGFERLWTPHRMAYINGDRPTDHRAERTALARVVGRTVSVDVGHAMGGPQALEPVVYQSEIVRRLELRPLVALLLRVALVLRHGADPMHPAVRSLRPPSSARRRPGHRPSPRERNRPTRWPAGT